MLLLTLVVMVESITKFFFTSVLWNPSGDGKQLVTLSEQHLKIWQLNDTAQAVQVVLTNRSKEIAQCELAQWRIMTIVLFNSPHQEIDTTVLEGKGQPQFTTGAWNPHHGGSQLATANENMVRGWDLRSMR